MPTQNIMGMRFGTIGRILSAIYDLPDGKSHGYELKTLTGFSLRNIYDVLPILIESGLLKDAGYDEKEGRKYVSLTDSGKDFAELYKKTETR